MWKRSCHEILGIEGLVEERIKDGREKRKGDRARERQQTSWKMDAQPGAGPAGPRESLEVLWMVP